MLHLHLYNFKCYRDNIFEFPLNRISLLKGDSGKGKSTVFEAISWCLYGNIRGVDSHQNKTAKLFVEITFKIGQEKITIFRRKRKPGKLLRLTRKGLIREDKVAQEEINEIFGLPEKWESICYSKQSDYCNLLNSSNAAKLEFLSTMAFEQQEPSYYINKIKSEVKRCDGNYKNKIQIYERQAKSYVSFKNGNKLSKKQAMTEEQIEKNSQDIKEFERKVEEFYRRKIKFEKLKSQKSEISLRIRQKEEELSSISLGVMKRDISELEKEILLLRESLHHQEEIKKEICRMEGEKKRLNLINIKFKKIKQKIKNLEFSISPNRIGELAGNQRDRITRKEEQKLREQRKLREDNLKQCQRLKLEYTVKCLEKEKKVIHQILEAQSELKIRKKLTELTEELKPYLEMEETDLEEKKRLERELLELKQGLNVLECPACSSSLRYQRGKLVSSGVKSSSQDDINDINNKINSEKKKQKDWTSKTNLERQIENTRKLLPKESNSNFKLLNPRQKKMLQNKLNTISSIQIIPEVDLDPDLIGDILVYREELAELEKVKSSLNGATDLEEYLEGLGESSNYKKSQEYTVPETFDCYKIKNKIKNLNQKIKSTQEARLNYDYLQKEIKNLKIRENNLILLDEEDFDGEIKNSKKEIQLIRTKIEIARLANKMVCDKSRLVELKNELTTGKSKLFYSSKIKNFAEKLESQLLQGTVDNINNTIEDIVSKLFDDPITVTINLFKTLKSKKTVKNQVNLQILYKGGEYDSIKGLSGGEKSRVSLALTIALNKISTVPFLFLDEPFGALNSDLRELCIECIREHCYGKTVVCINHEDVEGYYDHVINI